MKLFRFVLALATSFVVAFAAPAADVHNSPVVLVAKPQLGGFFQRTVIFGWPVGAGAHVGFILNRPTEITTEEVYTGESRPSGFSDPVFLGGPQWLGSVFVLAHQFEHPGGSSMQVAKETFLVKDSATVERIIKKDSRDARFFTGMVVWPPGELDAELRRGLWYVKDYDAGVVFRDSTDGLWEALSHASARAL
jgi:putative AlgH/UPF0301 family transcriptional regulator